jgi:prepilin-type N-terminal cleavage/methylation domain-containing protein
MTIFHNKGFTLIEITLVIVFIAILLAITTPLVFNVVARNDVGSAHESLYNAILRAQQLSKNQYKNSQWRLCLDNTNKQYIITSVTCSDLTNAEIIKISSNITISSEQTLDILFKAISGELDNTSNSITITLTGGGASKSIMINPSGVIDKEANTASASNTSTPSIVTSGLVLQLDAGNIGSYPGTGTTWTDLS